MSPPSSRLAGLLVYPRRLPRPWRHGRRRRAVPLLLRVRLLLRVVGEAMRISLLLRVAQGLRVTLLLGTVLLRGALWRAAADGAIHFDLLLWLLLLLLIQLVLSRKTPPATTSTSTAPQVGARALARRK